MKSTISTFYAIVNLLLTEVCLCTEPVSSTRLNRGMKILDVFAHGRSVVMQYIW